MSQYVRTRGGDMVHRSDCRYAKTGTEWLWPENREVTDDRALLDLIDEVGAYWLTVHSCVLRGDCSVDCLKRCAYPGQFSECST